MGAVAAERTPVMARRQDAASELPLAPVSSSMPALSSQSTPVAFSGTIGMLYPGAAAVAVLMLAPVGYEELCLRSTWRTLAEALSLAGIACLRFDYPGLGDALDVVDPSGLDDWEETVRAAADLLRQASGCSRLILLGQGLGGTLALRLADALAPVSGCVVMAPVVNGKRYLRELSVWTRIVADRIGIGMDPDDDTGCAVAGLRLPPSRLAAIGRLNLLDTDSRPCNEVLLLSRSGHAGDAALATHLAARGAAVTTSPYQGYEMLTTDPTGARPPLPTIAAIVAWVAQRARAPEQTVHAVATAKPYDGRVAQLSGPGFIESPVRFGPDGRLFGVVCEPEGRSSRSSIVFVNAGRDYHIGWARVTVAQARAFAVQGIASLRFDTSGIGDSLPDENGPEEVLYSEEQIADVRLALDVMERRGYQDPILIGRCSGAYAAFHAAVADVRVRHLVMVNNERFIWDPDESVEDAIRYAHRSVGDFGATLKRKGGLRRLLTGQLRVGPAGRYLAFRLLKHCSIRLAPVLGRLTKHGRLRRECHRRFGVLATRKVNVALIYAQGDIGMAEFNTYFGKTGEGLSAYRNVSFATIPDADHNFTHLGAALRLRAKLLETVKP
ncbi:serine aminopeptidase S33 family [Bosea psychrotolerans]|uniref:Serine aminopeptidase S33 family n=2 Tax=Bosea psychrotolerans TaxID=1871628 RepID=A0A2S4M847_9HYPH|nr:serine aminopeptidase S33 family [Bosea psychrotolerans]